MQWLMRLVPVVAVIFLDDYQVDGLGSVGGTAAVFGLLLTIVFVWSAVPRGNVLGRRRDDRSDAWHDDRSGGTARLAR